MLLSTNENISRNFLGQPIDFLKVDGVDEDILQNVLPTIMQSLFNFIFATDEARKEFQKKFVQFKVLVPDVIVVPEELEQPEQLVKYFIH